MSAIYPMLGWTVGEWREAVASGALGQDEIQKWFESIGPTDPAWIYLAPWPEVARQLRVLFDRLQAPNKGAFELPLCGVPFAVKDNIDVGGWPTTAACPAFRYIAEEDATVVRRLKEAGGIVVGKTNLDQFATGLVGTRSPFGTVPSAFNAEYIAGGSSSGSASLVTRGILPFTLGTDTAGSGRVPAAFGNIVGLKPTRGVFSTKGVVPACRTLDCVSVFSKTAAESSLVGQILSAFDELDPYSRALPADAPSCAPEKPRVGLFEPLEFFGDKVAERAFFESLERLKRAGFEFVGVSSEPFFQLAALLYAGPWVAERSLTAGALLDGPADLMDPVVREILLPARKETAEDAFRSEYQRAEFAAAIQRSFAGLEAILVPTTATTYKIEDVKRDPLGTNARLGAYTNFTNLSDLCGVAVPGRFRADGLPSGLTFLGPALSDRRMLALAERAHRAMNVPLGATGRALESVQEFSGADGAAHEDKLVAVAVVGAHLSGMALNHQLTDRGARLLSKTKTAASYRLFLLSGSVPQKPGLMRVEEGASIDLEVWEMSVRAFGEFTAEVPAPLGIGNVQLSDDSWVKGFICEPCGLEGAQDISAFGGFAAYLEQHGKLPN